MRALSVTRIATVAIVTASMPMRVGAQGSPTSATIHIDRQGYLSLEITVGTPHRQFGTSAQVALTALWLPMQIASVARITSAPDVVVSNVATGPGFTLMVLLSKVGQPLKFSATAFATVSHNQSGQALVEFDMTQSNMTESEQLLAASDGAISDYDLKVVLPHAYGDTEIGLHNASHTLGAEYQVHVKRSTQTAWISFPNPLSQSSNIAKTVFSLLVGVLTLMIQVPATRNRKLLVTVVTFLVSALVLLALAYYAFALAERFQFLAWAAGLVPHVVYSFCASIFLIVVSRTEATVTGRITVDGSAAAFASVKLIQRHLGQERQVRQVETLDADGRYTFRVRKPQPDAQYFVQAAMIGGAGEVSTAAVSLRPKDRRELGEIVLTRSVP